METTMPFCPSHPRSEEGAFGVRHDPPSLSRISPAGHLPCLSSLRKRPLTVAPARADTARGGSPMASRARLVALVTGFTLMLAPTHDAAARKFQMSGNWVMRNGQVFLPLQFAATAGGILGKPSMSVTPRPKMHISMGNLTGAFLFPNGAIPGAGVVTALGSGPATLRVRPNLFSEDARALIGLAGIDLGQITTHVGIRAPFATATLAAAAGPGSFTWCPQDPACVAG